MPVDLTAVARVVGIETTFVNLRGNNVVLLPQQVAVIGSGSTLATYTPNVPVSFTSAAAVGTTYGFGSPLHLAVLELLPPNGDGLGTIPMTVYPLAASGTAATFTITAAGTLNTDQTYTVTINGVTTGPIALTTADTTTTAATAISDAITAALNVPVTSASAIAVVTTTAKAGGSWGNGVDIAVNGTIDGMTFTVAVGVTGASNPSVQPALDQITNKWETMIVNCWESTDAPNLNLYQTFGDGRWGVLIKKPLVVTTGTVETVVATLTGIGDGRKTDRVNSLAVVPGSTNLPLQLAARQVARIAPIANNNPPLDYGGQSLTGITPGADGDQFPYVDLNTLVKAGISTTELIDGIATMSDTVTFYHPDGEDPPAFRYVVDIVKLQNIIFNLNVIFESAEWNGAPLIPDDQPTTNRDARKPKDAISVVAQMLDGLGLLAIISDPAAAKALISAVINSLNPKRLDLSVTVQLSGNANVISIDLLFGFFFGTQAIAA